MADFRTHVTVASLGSGLLSTMCLGAGVAGPREVIALAVVGAIGGILPDIDSDHSSPIKILFTVLGFVTAFLVVFCHVEQYSILELWLLWIAVYLFVRYGVWQAFARFTVHRGIFHSLAAAGFFGLLITNLSARVFGCSPLLSWIVGAFVCFGYTVHLLLDEIFSVDFMNTRIKRSFGTALKVIDYHNLTNSALLLGVTYLLYTVAPSAESFTGIFFNEQIYQNIQNRFWPNPPWFS